MAYQIKIVTGKDHEKRGIAFLISNPSDRKITAKDFFDGLDDKNVIKRMFLTRFDSWRDGQPNKTSRYHGWDKSEFKGQYTQCFVFKYKNIRLYGFLCNPKEKNSRYQICILVRHAKKKERETDEIDLKQVEGIRSTVPIQKTIKDFFKE